MKSLTATYTNDAMTQLFKESGAFFAFSLKQFEEKKKEGVFYCFLDGGLIVPKEAVNSVLEGLENIGNKGIELDLAENGRHAIIKRELMNYECFYTGDITDCVQGLEHYGIEADEIRSVYREMLANDEIAL